MNSQCAAHHAPSNHIAAHCRMLNILTLVAMNSVMSVLFLLSVQHVGLTSSNDVQITAQTVIVIIITPLTLILQC